MPVMGGSWNFPSTPEEFIKRNIETPSIVPAAGLFGIGKSVVIKSGMKTLPFLGGILAGTMFGKFLSGGGSQEQDITQEPTAVTGTEQEQDIVVIPDIDPIQDTEGKQDIIQDLGTHTTYNIYSGAGAIDFMGGDIIPTQSAQPTIAPVQETPVNVIIPQIAIPTTIAAADAGQEAKQEGGISWLMLAAIGIGAYFLMRKR